MADDASGAYARFYDFDADFDHDVAFYTELAAGRDVLELAAGTGRLLAPLEAASASATGLDISTAMLAGARGRLGDRSPTQLVAGDMRCFALRRQFGLIVLAANALCLPGTPAGQEHCLRRCREHVAPEGILAIDLPNPGPFLQNRRPFGQELHLYTRTNPATGRPTARYATHIHDPVHQVVAGDSRYVEHAPDGTTRSYPTREVLRYLHPQELSYLLRLTGFAPYERWGWFDRRAFDATSRKLIVLARPV